VFQIIGIIGFLFFGGTFSYRPPTQFSFVVGENELHEVTYVHSEAVTDTRIYIDGEPYVKSDRFWHEPRRETFHFQVGSTEIHQVEIQRLRSRLGNFWSGTTFTISVDGQELTAEQIELTRGSK